MDEKIAERLLSSKYYGDYIFAFDHLKDKAIIEKNLSIWRKYSGTKIPKLYVLCGFDSQDEKDIAGTFERIKVLMKYGSLPYIMRFEKYKDSKYKGEKRLSSFLPFIVGFGGFRRTVKVLGLS
jgi:hypothetical protein